VLLTESLAVMTVAEGPTGSTTRAGPAAAVAEEGVGTRVSAAVSRQAVPASLVGDEKRLPGLRGVIARDSRALGSVSSETCAPPWRTPFDGSEASRADHAVTRMVEPETAPLLTACGPALHAGGRRFEPCTAHQEKDQVRAPNDCSPKAPSPRTTLRLDVGRAPSGDDSRARMARVLSPDRGTVPSSPRKGLSRSVRTTNRARPAKRHPRPLSP
jgi:hypothetical protein